MPDAYAKARAAGAVKTEAIALLTFETAVLTKDLTVMFLILFYIFLDQRWCADVKEQYTSKRTSPN